MAKKPAPRKVPELARAAPPARVIAFRPLRILIANGVNLDLLGQREAQHYGTFTLADLERELTAEAPEIARAAGAGDVALAFFQSNDEGAFLNTISGDWDGAVINAAAWTHTSVALADRLRATGLPFVETHISNVAAREPFRHHSYTASVAAGVVFGFGMDSYRVALFGLLRKLAARGAAQT